MTDQEMREILETTLATQSKNARFQKRQVDAARLSGPVSPVDFARLERYAARHGTQVPPSFAQFLRITDGIEDYCQVAALSIRSAARVMESREIDDEWKDFAPLHEFVIASGDYSSDFIAFDRDHPQATGELPVVWIDGRGDRTEFPDFVAFLREQLRFQVDVLATNEADRANLPAD
jgi:hypothetical protein